MQNMHRVLKKGATIIIASNFAKCWSIFQILSPTDLAVNLY